MRSTEIDISATYGNHWCSAWPVEDGVSWVQTRCPTIGQFLRKTVECRQVVWGCGGAYLATYEVKRTIAWVRDYLMPKISSQFPNEMRGVKCDLTDSGGFDGIGKEKTP